MDIGAPDKRLPGMPTVQNTDCTAQGVGVLTDFPQSDPTTGTLGLRLHDRDAQGGVRPGLSLEVRSRIGA